MRILAFGGGLNSSALLVEATTRGIAFDAILFADTGAERPDTYRHIATMRKWAAQNGQPEIERVAYVDRFGKEVTLEQRCLDQKMLPSLVYGFKKCSLRYKRAPQDKRMNNHPAAREVWKQGRKVEKWIGIDADEAHRAKIKNDAKYNYRYPLVEWDMGRHECRQIMIRAGLQVPGKSSCFFCPAMRITEIRKLRDCYPDLLKRALAMEKNANLTTLRGLGGRLAWRTVMAQDEAQQKLFTPPVACDCYDGDD